MTIPLPPCAAIRRVRARHAVNVNGGERFVEHPQRGAGQATGGQRHPALLPGREPATGTSSNPASPACASAWEAQRAVAGWKKQVLPRRQAGFNPRLVPYPQQAAMESCRARGGVRLPVHPPPSGASPVSRRGESFFRAVAAGDLHPLPCIHGERHNSLRNSASSRPARSTDPGFKHQVVIAHIQVDMAYKHPSRAFRGRRRYRPISFCGESVPTLITRSVLPRHPASYVTPMSKAPLTRRCVSPGTL